MLYFESNKEEIVSEICVEKDLEVNTCQGNCHLMKLLEEDQSDDNEEGTIKLQFELEENIIPEEYSHDLAVFVEKTQISQEYLAGLIQPFYPSDFPPPRV